MSYKASDRLYGVDGAPPQAQIVGWDDVTHTYNSARVDQFGKLASDTWVWDTGTMAWVPASGTAVATNVGILNAANTRVNPSTEDTLAKLNGFSLPVFDYIALGYTGSNLTSVVYKTGGSGGTTVATLTLGYTGSDLVSVARS